MNYQHKYLKYKSKYLEKKYGHIQIFSYKIDNNNDLDLDYKQKYLKYKSKYLNIKYGGAGPAKPVTATPGKPVTATPAAGKPVTPAAGKPVTPAAATPPAGKPTPAPALPGKPTPAPAPAPAPAKVVASKAPVAAIPAAASTSFFSKIVNLAKSAGTMISNLSSKPTFIADAMKAHMLRNQNDSRSEPDTRNYYKKNNDMIFKTTILKDIQKESTKHAEIAEAIRSVLLIHKTKDPNLLDFQKYLENLVISYNAEKDKKKK